jgi:integrase
MAKELTTVAIAKMKPGSTRQEIPDGRIAGLYFIIQPSGKRSWAVRYRFGGKPIKLTIGAYPAIELKTARERAGAAKGRVEAGIDPGAEKKIHKAAVAVPASDIIEKVAARFVTQHAKRNLRTRSAYEIARLLENEIISPWRGRRLSQINRGDIHELLDAIIERGSPVMANRALSVLRTMSTWAIERGIIESNPCAGIKPPTVETARERVLSDSELVAVWRAADGLDPPYAEFVKLLVLTGQRRTEVAAMEWREVDLDAKLWTLPKERAKNDREHTVPLSDSAVEILRALPRIAGSDFALTLSGRRPICAYQLIKIRLDALTPSIPHWTWHDLRRTFATGCAKLGVTVHVVEAVLNHRSGTVRGVAAIYNRYSYDAEKLAAMMAWAAHVAALVTGTPAGNVVEFK